MRIDLSTLLPNPTRDLEIDPIDKARVAGLRQSIREYDFWGGVVVGKVNGSHVILAGHSRVAAALAEGVTHASLTVLENPKPRTMLRIYGVENATQRGVDNTSIAGAVAGAIKLIARQLFEEDGPNPQALSQGIGASQVVKFLHGIPGINKTAVLQQIANLKASGHYVRLIQEVEHEIEAEAKAAAEEAERRKTNAAKKKAVRTRQAVDRAKKVKARATRPVTFDLVGVQQHLKKQDHVTTFRGLVTSKGIAEALKVERQAELAQAIVAEAETQQRELTSDFIHEVVSGLLANARYGLDAQTRKQLRDESDEQQIARYQHHFEIHIHAALRDLQVIAGFAKGKNIKWSSSFLKAVRIVHTMSDDFFTVKSGKPQMREIGHAANSI